MRLIEQLRWWATECDRTNFGCQVRKLLLEAAEALEKAEPVTHGRWVEVHRTPFGSSAYRCSVCDGYMPFYNGYKYCPHCGAKMDGGNNDG